MSHYQQSKKRVQRIALALLFLLATATAILDTTATVKQIWVSLGQYWGGQGALDATTVSTMKLKLDIICG